MGLLFRLLRQNISLWQLFGFLVVNLLGGVIVLCGTQALMDFSSFTGLLMTILPFEKTPKLSIKRFMYK